MSKQRLGTGECIECTVVNAFEVVQTVHIPRNVTPQPRRHLTEPNFTSKECLNCLDGDVCSSHCY